MQVTSHVFLLDQSGTVRCSSRVKKARFGWVINCSTNRAKSIIGDIASFLFHLHEMNLLTVSVVLIQSFFTLIPVRALSSDDIPRATSVQDNSTNTCGWTTVPPLTLASCTDPVASHLPDLRGHWLDEGSGHSERIEQCGDRIIVTGFGSLNNGFRFAVHDFLHVDGTYENGLDDYYAPGFPNCIPLTAVAASTDPEGRCIILTSPAAVPATTRCKTTQDSYEFFYGASGITRNMTRAAGPPPDLETLSPTQAPTSFSTPRPSNAPTTPSPTTAATSAGRLYYLNWVAATSILLVNVVALL